MLSLDTFNLEEHQQRALQKATAENCPNVFILWHKMGTGKSRTALAVAKISEFEEIIIVCRRVAFGTWIDEIKEVQFDCHIYENNYRVDNLHRYSRVRGVPRVLLISAGDLKNIPQKLNWGKLLLIVDELYLFSNPKSQRSLAIQRLSLFCSCRVGLSGTIMPNRDNATIFGQLMALQAHRFLASSLEDFKKKYKNRSKGMYGMLWENKKHSVDVIKEKLAPMIDVYFPESRPTKIQIVKLQKDKAQIAAVKELQDLYEHKEKTYDYALQIVHAVNGISNGWFVDRDGHVCPYKSEKIVYTRSLVDDLLTANERVVIWCAYHNDIARLATELKDIPFLEFSAATNFDVELWNSGKIKVVLATEANGSSVNYFKHVKYAIYFSINFKLLDLQQSMTRHERKGSSHDGAHYYFLQIKGTLDAHTYDLVTKSDLAEKELILQLGDTIKTL